MLVATAGFAHRESDGSERGRLDAERHHHPGGDLEPAEQGEVLGRPRDRFEEGFRNRLDEHGVASADDIRVTPGTLAEGVGLQQLADDGDPCDIRVSDRNFIRGDALELNDAEVREPGHDQARELRQRRLIVQGRAEQLAGLGQKLKICLARS